MKQLGKLQRGTAFVPGLDDLASRREKQGHSELESSPSSGEGRGEDMDKAYPGHYD